MHLAGLGTGAMMLPFPVLGNEVAPEMLVGDILTVAQKKQLADVALNTAKGAGATYADARIGRYLNQYVFTREDKVQRIQSTESFGVGVRVIANGTWGFASTNDVTMDGIKKATENAVAIYYNTLAPIAVMQYIMSILPPNQFQVFFEVFRTRMDEEIRTSKRPAILGFNLEPLPVLGASQVQQVPAGQIKKFCVECGSEIVSNGGVFSKFCGGCGTPIA